MNFAPLPGHQVVDLSLLLSADLPCYWPGHLPYQPKVWSWFATRKDIPEPVYSRGDPPYATRWIIIDEHTGTHFDAPSHFIPPPDSGLAGCGPAGDVTAEKVALELLMGPAAVIDVSEFADGPGSPGVSPLLIPEVVTEWEGRHGRLVAPQVVLFRTGWDSRYVRGPGGDAYLRDVVVTRRLPGWPAPDAATVALLLERGVRCVGTDAPSMGAAHDGATAHLAGLSSGAVFVECLTGLDRLPARGSWFCFLPLKVEGGTGSPGRAFALVPG